MEQAVYRHLFQVNSFVCNELRELERLEPLFPISLYTPFRVYIPYTFHIPSCALYIYYMFQVFHNRYIYDNKGLRPEHDWNK